MTIKKKKLKKRRLPNTLTCNKDEGAERWVTESPSNACACRETTSLVAQHPTNFKVNKVGEYEDDEEDEIKLAECGQVEAEVREEKVGVRYVKDGEEGWTPVVRRKTSARRESGDSSCDLDLDGWKLVEYRCFIPGAYIHGRNPTVRQWLAVKPAQFLQGLELIKT